MEHAHTSVHYMNILLIRQTASTRSSILFYFVIFLVPFIILALLFSLPPGRNSDPGSHGRLLSPPTHYWSCLAFLSREDFSSALSSLVDSRWILLTHARRSQQLILFFFLFCKQIQNPATAGFELMDQHTSRIRGLPLDHRGDRQCIFMHNVIPLQGMKYVDPQDFRVRGEKR